VPTDTPQPEPKWRVVITDAESASGVAPICPSPALFQRASEHWNDESMDLLGVWDCCPGPHLQCINEDHAKILAAMLNILEVEICS